MRFQTRISQFVLAVLVAALLITLNATPAEAQAYGGFTAYGGKYTPNGHIGGSLSIQVGPGGIGFTPSFGLGYGGYGYGGGGYVQPYGGYGYGNPSYSRYRGWEPGRAPDGTLGWMTERGFQTRANWEDGLGVNGVYDSGIYTGPRAVLPEYRTQHRPRRHGYDRCRVRDCGECLEYHRNLRYQRDAGERRTPAPPRSESDPDDDLVPAPEER